MIRVLIADDSAFMRKILTDFFNKQPDFEVAGAAINGKEAINKVMELSPDLVTMDVNMPVMDGLEATKKIRALPREDSHNIPILALTADAFREDMEKCRAAGMNEHLAKPVNPNELIQVLMRYI